MVFTNTLATSMPKWGALLFEKRSCFLDHLIPICHLFNIPLITNDTSLLALAEHFYPPTQLLYYENPIEQLHNLELIFYGQPYSLFPRGICFPEFFYPHKIRTCCTLHGNSEKYLNDFWLEKLIDEDIVLIYGSLLVDLLKEKGVYHRLKAPILAGNLRYQFYKQHQLFFEKKSAPFLFPKNNKKRILWAPTWDRENQGLFFSLAEQILPQLPHDFHLIIKLHRLMVLSSPKEVEELKNKYSTHKNISILEEMPLIYPLLAETDLFLGDTSSVAYDFLAFNRPIYFFAHEVPLLHSLGRIITPDEIPNLFHIMSEEEDPKFAHARKQRYAYAFAEEVTVESVRREFTKV